VTEGLEHFIEVKNNRVNALWMTHLVVVLVAC
jgi:hypothetical protein